VQIAVDVSGSTLSAYVVQIVLVLIFVSIVASRSLKQFVSTYQRQYKVLQNPSVDLR
jgi:uncharacterized membrane protein YwzB